MKEKIRVAVIFGGQSSEHEVSRVSAQSVIENLDSDKYEIIAIGINKQGKWLPYSGDVKYIATGEWESISLNELKSVKNLLSEQYSTNAFIQNLDKNEQIDIVFPVLHGTNGEDGTIQGLLELAGVPYVGCGVLAACAGMDKVTAKKIFDHAGIPQGKYLHINRHEILDDIISVITKIEEYLGYPIFVKPSNAGSSVGVSKAKNKDELKEALTKASKYDRRILLEEFIDGREIECGVLGNNSPIASVVGEVIPSNEFYDYEAKYVNGDSKVIIPADLDENTIEIIQTYAQEAFKALDCAGIARVDFFIEKNTGRILINEVNTMPGFTSISMYPKLFDASGIPYKVLLDSLIKLGFERFNENHKSLERT